MLRTAGLLYVCALPGMAHVSQCSLSEPSLEQQAPVRLHQIHTFRADRGTPQCFFPRKKLRFGIALGHKTARYHVFASRPAL